jgi:arylsulfatase
MGKLDNTIIIYINGDNGTSSEGTLLGTPNETAMFNSVDVPIADQLKYFYDVWGTDQTYPHMAVPWAWAFDTPYSWTKQIASHLGGIRQGMCISWPGHIKDVGGIRNQFHHMIDVAPTLLEIGGIPAPEYVDGIKQAPIEGVSFAYTFDEKNANTPTRHKTQYFEMFGDHAIYHDGWMASTKVMRPPWVVAGGLGADPLKFPMELYDLNKDWTQSEDVAAGNPEKLKEMQALFMDEARKYQVLPLDASVVTRVITPRPSITAGRDVFTWTVPMTGTPMGDAPSVLNTSYNFKAEVEIPEGGAEGMIITQGGRFGGYGFYVLKNKPVFCWNMLDLKRLKWEGPDALTPGKHTLEYDFKYDGLGFATLAFASASGVGQGGTGTLKVDGKEVATQKMEHTIPFILQIDESLDIGSDTLTGVNDADYQPPFKFTGKLNKVTLALERPKLTPEDVQKLKDAEAKAADAR